VRIPSAGGRLTGADLDMICNRMVVIASWANPTARGLTGDVDPQPARRIDPPRLACPVSSQTMTFPSSPFFEIPFLILEFLEHFLC